MASYQHNGLSLLGAWASADIILTTFVSCIHILKDWYHTWWWPNFLNFDCVRFQASCLPNLLQAVVLLSKIYVKWMKHFPISRFKFQILQSMLSGHGLMSWFIYCRYLKPHSVFAVGEKNSWIFKSINYAALKPVQIPLVAYRSMSTHCCTLLSWGPHFRIV